MTLVRHAAEGDIDACATVLALAFQEDPGSIVVEPDGARRAELLPRFFRNFIAAALAEDADILVAGDPVVGVASWFGPHRYGPSPEALGAHGFGDVMAIAGEEATERLLGMVGELERQHDELITGPHFRLEFFGVMPTSQRSGIGTALIEFGHERADGLGLSSYLETFTEPNLRYYERRGYRLMREFEVADGVPVYALIRPPATAAGWTLNSASQ